MKKIMALLLSIASLSQGMCNNIVWSVPPTLVSSASGNASNPQIATDANGNLVAAWIENGAVIAKSKLLNMPWSSPSTLSTNPAITPRIVSDANGNATAVWLENGIVRVSSKSLNGNWSNAMNLSNGGAGYPTIAVNSTGDVIIGWSRSGNVETTLKLFGGNWKSLDIIASSNATYPQIALGGNGSNKTAAVVWQQTTAGTSVFSSTKRLTRNFSPQQMLSDPNHNAAFATVAVDGDGNATALWYLYDITNDIYSNVTLQTSSRLAGGDWTDAYALSAPGIRNPSTLVARIAYDGVGNAIALWNTSFDDETFDIQSSVKPFGQPWSSVVDLVRSNLYAFGANLQVCSLGDALALYMFYNGKTLTIKSAETDITGFMNNFWSVPTLISAGSENASPQGAITLSGNAIHAAAVWLSSNGTHNHVFASTGTKSLPLPPSNLTVSQTANNLGIYTEYYNTLTWTASTDPSVVGYLVYRNGTFLAEVSENVLHYIDYNRTPNVVSNYTVASINGNNNYSSMVTAHYP
jgi:hypothetical protein